MNWFISFHPFHSRDVCFELKIIESVGTFCHLFIQNPQSSIRSLLAPLKSVLLYKQRKIFAIDSVEYPFDFYDRYPSYYRNTVSFANFTIQIPCSFFGQKGAKYLLVK